MLDKFQKIAPESLWGLLGDGAVVDLQQTRLDGGLAQLRGPTVGELFVKYGSGQQRVEILREVRFLGMAGDGDKVPKCIGCVDDSGVAFLVLRKIHGSPLHDVWTTSGREAGVRVLCEVLAFLSSRTDELLTRLPSAVREELDDIRLLLDSNAVDVAAFKRDSGGVEPGRLYDTICERIPWDREEILSHGDLCLPNILVQPDGNWSLIDWGKSGRGPIMRDLASLEGSLSRNGCSDAFGEVLRRIGIAETESLRAELQLYRGLDLFWYHATSS